MVYDPGNRKDVRRAEKAAKLAARQRQEIVTQVMGGTPGRAWMHSILASCNVFASTFTGEALSSAFSEGRRSVGLQLLADIMLSCPDHYITMMRESNERDAAAEYARSKDTNGGIEAGGGDSGDSEGGTEEGRAEG